MPLVAYLDVGRSERVRVKRGGTLRGMANVPFDVIVDNLSRTGCLFAIDRELMLDASISIGIPGIGIRKARISRVDHPSYACAFVVPLSDIEIAGALSTDTIVAGAFPEVPDPAAAGRAGSPVDRDAFVEDPETPKLPIGMRLAVIVGASVVLWSGLIGAFIAAVR